MSIWRPKKNTLFDAAMNKVSSLSKSLSNDSSDLIPNKWMQIIPEDPNSPMIMGIGDNKHLIYYPPNSTPYLHKYETSVKFVEILSGYIKDLVSGKEYKTGDKIKIYPGDNVQPYTGEKAAYVRVCVSSIDDIWERVCE